MSKFELTKPADAAGKIVTMHSYRDRLSLSPIRQAEAYWTALREGASIPRRAQVDPRGLRDILEYSFILERIAPGTARFRLAGQHLGLLAGMEVRGMPLTALFTPSARTEIGVALEKLFDGPSVTEFSLKSEARYGHPPIQAHMILLPLKNDAGEIGRALGVIVSDFAGRAAPNRFTITGSSIRPVSGLNYDWSSHDRAPVAPGFAEPAPEAPSFATTERRTTPSQPPKRGKPHLRVVK